MCSAVVEDEWGSNKEHWTVVGAKAVGTNHHKSGAPCQDQIDWIALEDGTVFLAAADGAGSAENSETGALIAVQSVRRVAPLLWSRPQMRADVQRTTLALFRAAARSVRAEAARLSVSPRTLATTLTVVCIGLLESAVGRVGDGLVAIESDKQIFTPMNHAQREYANEATFITAKNWRCAMQIECIDSRAINAISLSSDGLRLVACADTRLGSPYTPFYEDVFGAIRGGMRAVQLESFLQSVEDRTGDDKSLLVAARGQ